MLHRLDFRRRPLVVIATTVAVIAVAASAGLLGRTAPGPDAGAVAVATSAVTPGATAAPASPAPAGSASAVPSATPPPSDELVALVPIVSFWSTQRSITRAELVGLFGGIASDQGARKVAVSIDDRNAVARLLGVWPQARALAPADVRAFVKANQDAVGIVRADDVTVDVRALAVDGISLFGSARSVLAAWPLLVAEPGVTSAFAATPVWSIAAGGDVMLDKAVYAQSVLNRQGVDYAWFGGSAVIDRRVCCGWGHKPLAVGSRTGNAGAVGAIFRNADVAIVNLESPEPSNFRYHATGFVFTGDPALLAGLANAGIDVAGMANNHLGNGGTRGVTDTIRELDQLGVGHAGAGTGQAAARKPVLLHAGGQEIAVLAYSWVDPWSYMAGPGHPGSAMYSLKAIIHDIGAAKAAGADIVIVMPHWGTEYSDAVQPRLQADARAMVRAGADLILGSHSHWVGPFEQISPGHLAFYSLGDLVFDWTHDERTQEGVIVELSFVGTRLVQLDLRPTLIIAGQPNLLDPAGDGKAVLAPMRRTSQPLLGW
jgi:poly-gamma-glutamate capsule biosynthesis protein CapA/YwtB (metallophosphatase superfamily)